MGKITGQVEQTGCLAEFQPFECKNTDDIAELGLRFEGG